MALCAFHSYTITACGFKIDDLLLTWELEATASWPWFKTWCHVHGGHMMKLDWMESAMTYLNSFSSLLPPLRRKLNPQRTNVPPRSLSWVGAEPAVGLMTPSDGGWDGVAEGVGVGHAAGALPCCSLTCVGPQQSEWYFHVDDSSAAFMRIFSSGIRKDHTCFHSFW